MTDLGTLPTTNHIYLPLSAARGINDLGQVVDFSSATDGNMHAFLYSSGKMTDLNSLLPAGSGWTLESALAINGAGDIVGAGINPAGETHTFLLASVPEPSTLVLSVVGQAAVLSFKLFRHRGPRPTESSMN